MLDKTKYTRSTMAVNPFGTMFMSRLDQVNNKLTCSLSRAGEDYCTFIGGSKCGTDDLRTIEGNFDE